MRQKLETALIKGAKGALKQIESHKYISELTERGITEIIKIDLAFAGNHF